MMAAGKRAGRPSGTSLEVECVETGDRWENSEAAARALGVTKSAVYMAARSGGSCCGLHWRIEGHRAPSAPKRRPYHQCAVECVETGEVFPSFRQAAESVGVSRPALSRAVISGGRCAGFRWRRAGAPAGGEGALPRTRDLKGTASWPRWDDGAPLAMAPPIELKDGRRAARLVHEDGRWLLLDESGEAAFSLAAGDRLPRSAAARPDGGAEAAGEEGA